jgi:hypothetical protein
MDELDDWRRFWEWDYTKAFRFYFERRHTRRKESLMNALRVLPPALGEVQYEREFPGERLVVVFTHNRDNDGAELNQTVILSMLAEARALTFFGMSGAASTIKADFSRYHSYKYPNLLRETVFAMLRQHYLHPLEYIAINTRPSIDMWGVEDIELYDRAITALKKNARDYSDLIVKRSPVLIQNLVTTMEKMAIPVAGLWLMPYDFDTAHSFLNDLEIANIGVCARDEGPTDWGRESRKIRERGKGPLFGKRRIVLKYDHGGEIRYIESRIRVWYDLLLDPFWRLVGAIVNFGRSVARIRDWFAPSPRSFGEVAVRIQIATRKEKCQLCGALFRIPERSIASPKKYGELVVDLGGYCDSCGQMICEKHAQVLVMKREGRSLILTGCEVCGSVLSGWTSVAER